jgi:hypothetical protein
MMKSDTNPMPRENESVVLAPRWSDRLLRDGDMRRGRIPCARRPRRLPHAPGPGIIQAHSGGS